MPLTLARPVSGESLTLRDTYTVHGIMELGGIPEMSRLKVPDGARRVAALDSWTVYELRPRADDSPLWLQVKVMLPPGTPGRWGQVRQYRLRWNPDEQRFRRDAQRLLIETKEPDLYARVETLMSLEYPREWLKANQGLDDNEIAAERERLRQSRARA